jgi:hypothetical protein
MKLVIPATTLEVSRIHLSPFQETNGGTGIPIAPLSYVDSFFKMNDIEIITPPLTVESYDASLGRIKIHAPTSGPGSKGAAGIFATKINTLQDYIITTLHAHQGTILGRTDLKRETVEACFQKMSDGEFLHLFIAQNDTRTPVFTGDADKPSFGLSRNLSVADSHNRGSNGPASAGLEGKPGPKIRMTLRIGGVRVLPGNPYRFRLHHTLLNVFIVE